MSDDLIESQDSETAEATTNDQPPCEGEAPSEKPAEWVDLLGSGRILKKILQEGQPETRPLRHYFCTLSYTLSLEENPEKAIEQQNDFEIQLGDCEVVQGLDVAIGLMNVGEKCLLKIAPHLAFGDLGLKPDIPGDATVLYEIQLVSTTPDEELETLSLEDRKVRGNCKRERGNWWYGRGENSIAIQCYRRALDFLDEVEGGITDPSKEAESADSALQSLLEDRLSVYNNMAAAQIKLELYDAALTSLQTVLRCQPNNIKALFRKAKVYRAKNDLSSALKALKKADEVSPNDSDIQRELTTVTKLLQKQKSSERELAKRMFGEPTIAKEVTPNNPSKPNVLAWAATIAASFAVGLVGVAAYKFKFT